MTCLLAPGNHADVAARIQGFLAIEAQIARTLGQTCVAVIRLAQRCVAHIQNSPKVISPIILPLFLRENIFCNSLRFFRLPLAKPSAAGQAQPAIFVPHHFLNCGLAAKDALAGSFGWSCA